MEGSLLLKIQHSILCARFPATCYYSPCLSIHQHRHCRVCSYLLLEPENNKLSGLQRFIENVPKNQNNAVPPYCTQKELCTECSSSASSQEYAKILQKIQHRGKIDGCDKRLWQKNSNCDRFSSGNVGLGFLVFIQDITDQERSGKAIAIRLAQDGFDICVNDISANKAEIDQASFLSSLFRIS